MQIRDLAQARVSYGYRRLHVLLQREGWAANHKRVYRLYSQAIQPGGPNAEDEEAEAARVVSKRVCDNGLNPRGNSLASLVDRLCKLGVWIEERIPLI